jgi:hypothetical protein
MMRKLIAILMGILAGKASISSISLESTGLDSYRNPNGGHN